MVATMDPLSTPTALQNAGSVCGLACVCIPKYVPVSTQTGLTIPANANSVLFSGVGFLDDTNTGPDDATLTGCYSTNGGTTWLPYPNETYVGTNPNNIENLAASNNAQVGASGYLTTKTSPALQPGTNYTFAVCGFTCDPTNATNIKITDATGWILVSQ
jgi:hypothetical protein